MNAYSKDLRLRVLAAVDRGERREEIVRLFGVSLATIGRYVKRRRETGEVAAKPSPGRTRRICSTVEERRALWAQLEENGEATLEEQRDLWERSHGMRVSVATTMSRAIRRLGWTYTSKDAVAASERDEEARARWRRKRVARLDPERLVFLRTSAARTSGSPR